MKSIPPQDTQSDNNRFELRDAPGPGGNVVDKFATREAADAVRAERQRANPGFEYTIADMGVRSASAADQYAENGKTAEQKQQEEDQKKADAPDPNRRSVETPRRQDAHQ